MERFLVGTYTSQPTGRPADAPASRGAYLFAMNARGRIEVRDVCAMPDPSFVVLHPRLPLAYVVNETAAAEGGLSVVAIDGDRIARVCDVSSQGHLPCHLALLDDARAIAVTHYGCGTVAVFGLDARGLPNGVTRRRNHVGKSVHPRRQGSAHPHCAVVSADGLYVTDLGQDCIVHYGGDALEERSRCAIHRGAGPRHLVLDADRRVGWLSNELDNSVSRLAIASDGSLRELDWTSTLPAHFTGRSAVSEIALDPGRATLYVGNRGHDSIASFAVASDGALLRLETAPCGGRHPRHFALTRDGRTMVVANRDSDTLTPFSIGSRGELVPLDCPFDGVPAPVCVCWLPPSTG